MKGTLAFSWGRWGGFYVCWNGWGAITRRLCLGWFAVTWVGIEIDDLMIAYADQPSTPPAAVSSAPPESLEERETP